MINLPHKISRLLIISIIILSTFHNSHESQKRKSRLLQVNIIPIYNQPPEKTEDLDTEKQKLETDYQKKLEENNLLKKQIEKNIKYIKILLTTGIIMFSIILFILIKILYNYKKNNNKSSKIKIDKSILKNVKIKEDIISAQKQENNKNLIKSNDSIEQSNYNILVKSQINSSNNNISISEINNDLNNNSKDMSEEEVHNYDAPNMANFSGEVVNDDNRTLTNNPDVFIPSRMDRILYKPYPKEEIK